MRDIKNLLTTEKRSFELDDIPFVKLGTASGLELFSKQFNFKDIELGEDQDKNITQIRLSMGQYKVDGNFYPVSRMMIDRRSIGFSIFADSKISEKFFKEIVVLLSLLDPAFQHCKPILLSIETQCVATLDVDFMDIFSGNIRVLLDNATSTIASKLGDMAEGVSIRPKAIRFDVNFKTAQDLMDKSVLIAKKPLIIEPRDGTALNEKVYFTASPTDTNTHLKLLKQFEKLFSKVK